jgi:predicted nucleic acid-binding protein
MSALFVDTSALQAILDAEDPNHQRAVAEFENALGSEGAVTHNYVHVEAEQLVRRRLGAAAAARLLTELLPAMTTIWIDESMHTEAIRAMEGQGRAASLVDQVSFIVMRTLGIDTALAFDSDFERAGYRLPEVRRRHTLSETPALYGSTSPTAALVSVAELAARSGRSVNTIQSWRRRHADFPLPSVELAAGPIWLWADVSAWIDQRVQRSSPGAGR